MTQDWLQHMLRLSKGSVCISACYLRTLDGGISKHRREDILLQYASLSNFTTVISCDH